DLSVFPKDWHISLGPIRLALKPSANNQLGVFPEQCDSWQWITKKIRNAGRPLRILNAFAYTGAATLMSSAAARDVEVCHVDGAKTSVTWAKQNALLSGLESKSIRWIVDDVLKFLAREIKRGRTYDAFILDPPAFGRGAKTEWSLERDLPLLLDCVDQLLSPHPCFVVLSCHAPHMIATDLAHQLEKLPAFAGKQAQTLNLTIASKQGHALPLGICARI
ncbi:MAG TPA: class I SAM-dependent methyltransferase, partial [bacterium]|nr:class I SAM-dependent methyltransferase [bacterium]